MKPVKKLHSVVLDLIRRGALPEPAYKHRFNETLPGVIMNRVAFGVGLELKETACPKWADKTLIITRVQPELVSLMIICILDGVGIDVRTVLRHNQGPDWPAVPGDQGGRRRRLWGQVEGQGQSL